MDAGFAGFVAGVCFAEFVRFILRRKAAKKAEKK